MQVLQPRNGNVPAAKAPLEERLAPCRAVQMRTTGGCYIEKWLTKSTDDNPTCSCIVFVASRIRLRMNFERAGPNQDTLRLVSKYFEFQDCDLTSASGKRKSPTPVMFCSRS